jgi:arginyl-tRNA synthetase
MNLSQHLQTYTQAAFKQCFDADIDTTEIQVEETRKEFTGDRTVILFPLLKYARLKPEEAGQQVGDYLYQHSGVVKAYEVIKGFVNLQITDQVWLDFLNEEHQASATTIAQHPRPQTIMVEYSSPNTNKPQHLGHVRNNLLGFSMAEILKARGHSVIKANLINDRGIHICKSMIAWQRFGEGETPADAGVKGDQLVGKYYVKFQEALDEEVEQLTAQGYTQEEAEQQARIQQEAQELLQKWEAGDPEVWETWRTLNGWVYKGFEATYSQLGVDFDRYYYESDTYKLGKDLIQEGLDKGVFYQRDDGSVWADLTDEGLDEKLVLRRDGTAVYITQDLGTAQLKYDDYQLDQSLYVVGNEQDYHFQVLALILKKLGKPYADGIYHLSYGMVDLPSGKMKSREGTVVDADELMDEMEATARQYAEASEKLAYLPEEEREELYQHIGLAALKYYILKAEPKKRMRFDPEASIDFQGDTGPFLQYTHARIRSVAQKATGHHDLEQLSLQPAEELNESERAVLKELYKFGAKVAEAERDMAPSTIAHYAHELARTYNRFYQDCPILGKVPEATQQFRLALSVTVADTLARAMQLLGIHPPERM